ncbi:hypothetical protein LSUCC0031_07445 [Rhodobacterales bacterium LSUCC0031]|nr:hypothetical protein [Rhodobacterales bacterium LSUCC0031]
MAQHHRWAIWAAGLGLVVMASPLAAHVPQIVPPGDSTIAAPAAQARTARPMQFDWRANRHTPSRNNHTPSSTKAAPGRGSYICTAAGFGQMSRCVAR